MTKYECCGDVISSEILCSGVTLTGQMNKDIHRTVGTSENGRKNGKPRRARVRHENER